jgi:cytochrome c oxidase subunit 2
MRLLVFVAAMFCGASSHADKSPIIPPDEYVFCTVCHGVQLKGNPVIAAPRISRMETWYVERQLQAFKKGWRGRHERDISGMEMRPMAAMLSNDEIEAVAAYVHSVDSTRPAKTIQGDAERGRAYYASCVECHGENGEGKEALAAPSLTGVNDWYLVTQMKNYRDGTRGGSAGDDYGAQMRAAARILTNDQAIFDVVSYVSTLPSQQEK